MEVVAASFGAGTAVAAFGAAAADLAAGGAGETTGAVVGTGFRRVTFFIVAGVTDAFAGGAIGFAIGVATAAGAGLAAMGAFTEARGRVLAGGIGGFAAGTLEILATVGLIADLAGDAGATRAAGAVGFAGATAAGRLAGCAGTAFCGFVLALVSRDAERVFELLGCFIMGRAREGICGRCLTDAEVLVFAIWPRNENCGTSPGRDSVLL